MVRYLTLLLILVCIKTGFAERIYIMNAPGYNKAGPELINAMISNGHTVDENGTILDHLPANFTSSCQDPVNGYDWLCFFGNYDFSPLTLEIKQFIDAGGKVFYQYEVDCCTTSSTAVANIVSGVTGLNVVPNSNTYIAFNYPDNGYWAEVGCCVTLTGNAYKGLDGIPVDNQIQATADVQGTSPSISTCLNLGFRFTTTDFTGSANNGAFVGLGDVNIWYNAHEPVWAGGSDPVSDSVVDYFFPSVTDICYALPQGCILNNNYNAAYTLDLGNDTVLCMEDTLTLSLNYTASEYLWQDGTINATYEITESGLYWVDVIHECDTLRDSIQVTYFNEYLLDIGADTIICKDSLVLQTNLNGAVNFEWQDGSVTSTYTVATSGTYWVDVSSQCGMYSDTIHVLMNNDIEVDLGSDTTLCVGDTLYFSLDYPECDFLWDNNTTDSTHQVVEEGIYWVRVITSCDTLSDTIKVSFYDNQLNLGPDTVLCEGELVLDATIEENVMYQWQDGSSDSIFTVTTSGTYGVKVTDNCGVFGDTINVSYSSFNIDLGSDTVICMAENLLLEVYEPGTSYIWQDYSENSYFIVTEPGTYWITAVQGNCIASDTLVVNIKLCNVTLDMPNIITPNGDHVNDLLQPVAVKGIKSMYTKVYNRWGNLIYETGHPLIEWSAGDVPSGVYFWVLEYIDLNGDRGTKSGHVSVIK